MSYTVKNVKTFRGHDGNGWEASLYNPAGKRVAVVVEDGWGGGLQFHWEDHDQPRVETNGLDYKGNPLIYKDTPFESALRTHCLSLPEWEGFDGNMMATDMDIYVGGLVEDALTAKDLKKTLKKMAIVDGGAVYTYKCTPTHPTAREQIKAKYPNAVVLNDLPFDEALALFKKCA